MKLNEIKEASEVNIKKDSFSIQMYNCKIKVKNNYIVFENENRVKVYIDNMEIQEYNEHIILKNMFDIIKIFE